MAGRAVTPEDFLTATGQGSNETVEDIFEATETQKSDPRDQGSVTHKTPNKVRVYKPMPDGSYVPRDIPYQNLGLVLREGFRALCPFCNTNTCSGLPNECKGKMGIAFRRCPVQSCGKKLYDNTKQIFGKSEDSDPNEIVEDMLPTPEARTKAVMETHMLAFHPQEARALGIEVKR